MSSLSNAEYMQNMADIKFDPAPIGAKFINSMRSSGYEYKTAILEMIDNSQDANCTQVIVDFESNNPNKMNAIIIADDGDGMSYNELKNSFALGADRDYGEHDNGKFGMGGTNGALALAAVKVTITKKNGEYNIRKYDLHEVQSRDAWGSQSLDPTDPSNLFYVAMLDSYLDKMNSDSGTLIYLTNLDRMTNLNIKQVSGVLKKQYGKTYYHSLYTECLSITIGGESVRYDDPLEWNNPLTEQLIDMYVVEPSETNSGIKLRAVSVYNHPKKSHGRMAKSGGNIFRNNRLVESGVFGGSRWPGLWEKSQNRRDIRWALYFHEDSDEFMNLSNSKDSVSPNSSLVDAVVSSLKPWVQHYSDLRDSRDTSQTKEESERDLQKMGQDASDVLRDVKVGPQDPNDPRGSKDKLVKVTPETVVSKPKHGFEIVDEPCSKYNLPILIELNSNDNSSFKYVIKINTDNEFIRNHYNNKSAETKDSTRMLLISIGWSLYYERLQSLNGECSDTLREAFDNIESRFADNLRRLTRRQSL